MIEILYRGGMIRPHIRRPLISSLELQPIDDLSLKQPLTLHSCSSTPVITKIEFLNRRAESEKEFKKVHNTKSSLGDTNNKVEYYSKDNNIRNQLQPITEEYQNLKYSIIIKTMLIIQFGINKDIKILKNKYHKINFIQFQIIQIKLPNPNNFIALQIKVLFDILSIRIKQENEVILSLTNLFIPNFGLI
ncbi:unnamed protein product (macronuclear) [Paramecium tetraurelia]|uniref:Uncharacterized protein n=1 Tax=Paramecium tetraurelia TaxID=5888 RepID=A0DG92_PARTE|nr:uncharacterized protein GSPATT00002188001 [Paramecium tetraurelia]CAK82059.1 unnamed protein product [Paramecium tetraurelia]|eukprot:XP_001449456.1 hypothetical protein (macronuclear) [Paramecium tetraurelia strain d4-2]